MHHKMRSYRRSCPAALSFCAASLIILVMYGCGITTSSQTITPIFSLVVASKLRFFQGISSIGSVSHGSASETSLKKRSRSSILCPRGPTTAVMDSCPMYVHSQPLVGTRFPDGLKPYRPLNAAGTRIEPPWQRC